MTDALLFLALALLVGGVIASLIPVVPGGLLTLVGLLVYWIGIGDIWWPIMAALVVLVAVVIILDAIASVVAARAGGASWQTAAVAVLIGIALLFVLGPPGLFAGIAGTIFLVELRRGRSPEAALRAAGYATVAIVASKGVQFVVNVLVLVAVLWFGVL